MERWCYPWGGGAVVQGIPGFDEDDGFEILHARFERVALPLRSIEPVLEGPYGLFYVLGRRAELLLRSELP